MTSSTALTIGNFDGVHRGHVDLVQTARRAVGDGRVIVLSFDPHPVTVLRPGSLAGRLTRFEQRASLLMEAGADEVIPLRPTEDLLRLSPDAFIEQIVNEHRPTLLVEGPDFRFGHARSGTVQTLQAFGELHGFETIVIDPVEAALGDQHVVPVSSTMVRWLIAQGRVSDAAALMNRPYEMHATVVQGDRRGRELGYPTANLETDDLVIPADGVYAGFARRPDGAEFAAAISVGAKPTFGARPRTVEAHLIGYDGPVDEYGWDIRLKFNFWLRDQLKFDGVETLVQQLVRDVARTEDLMATGQNAT